MKRTSVIVQARMGSTRLPGKVLSKVLGKPLLELQWERMVRIPGADELMVATTDRPSDDLLAEFCRKIGAKVFRGSELDVLRRYREAAVDLGSDVIVRLTADCPLIDPEIVGRCIELLHSSGGKLDYVSNCRVRTFAKGMDAEVFTSEALETAHRKAVDPWDREHVTPYIWKNTEKFACGDVKDAEDFSHLRLTVDVAEDLELVKRVFEELYPRDPHFSYRDVLELLRKRPDWLKINAHVRQKDEIGA